MCNCNVSTDKYGLRSIVDCVNTLEGKIPYSMHQFNKVGDALELWFKSPAYVWQLFNCIREHVIPKHWNISIRYSNHLNKYTLISIVPMDWHYLRKEGKTEIHI